MGSMRDVDDDEVEEAQKKMPFEPGMAVKIVNVKSDVTLNGQLADIVRFSDKDGRWIVKVRDDGKYSQHAGKGKALKEENLEFLKDDAANQRYMFTEGDHVTIEGVTSDPTLNGQTGTIVKWDTGNSRWIVKMDETHKGKAMKGENLKLIKSMGH